MSYKKLIIKSKASVEIENAISHYSLISKSLAQKLEKEIRYSFLKIAKYPEGFQFRYKTIRIIWLKTFPYGIYYIFDSDEIYIIAFWHAKEDVVNKLTK
jgi:plasmid stabilization system protein ParE